MTLLTSLANKVRTPTYQCYIGGQPVQIVSASWDLGYDTISSSAVVVVAEIPSTMAFRQQLEIHAGWDGFTAPAYLGEIEQDQRGWFPFDGTIRASGYLRRAQSKHPNALSYSNMNDEELIEVLLPLAGVPMSAADIHGEGVTDLGTIQPVALSAGTPIINLINEIDQIFSYKTFDSSSGTVFRRRHAGLPSSTAAFTFTEGVNAYRITRRLGSVFDLNNQVNVYGLPQSGITWPTTRQASNPLVPDPPGFITFDLRSSLIETQIVATVLAQRLMGEVNGIPDEVEIETWGNPLIQPADTIEVTSPKDDLAAVHYWVKHLHSEITPNGYFMRIIGERREGDLGEEIGAAPIAQFVYRVSKETYEVGGVPTVMYTVTADGVSSHDPDSPPGSLTYAWSNNKNADTGTEVVYSTAFTEAQMRAATAPTITLTVSDGTFSGSVTKTISIDTDPINARPLYVAVSGRAEATGDGGETWQTWTPGAGTVISTAPIAAGTYGLFGLSNGKLMYTADMLSTAPTEAHDFGSQVDCIWVNEVNPDRVTVGLTNGQVHVTNNMTAIAGSTWAQLADFASAVLWIEESFSVQGQYRLAMGNQVLLSHDSLATTGELVNFGADTARNGATSFFSNYYAASSADEIKREDGTAITGDATSDIRAVAHHIRDDVLYAVNTAGQSYRKAPAATSLTAKVAISSPGTVNHMINDGDNQRIFYVAANQGLYKTFDEFGTVVRMRDYTGGGFDGLKVGRASLSLVNPTLTGRRVFVAGRTGTTARFGWTENIFAPSPVWTSNVTGLPTVANTNNGCKYMRYNPFDSSNTLLLVINQGANGDEIWRNTSARTGGTWSKIFDQASIGSPGALTINDLSYTIANNGFLGVACFDGTNFRFAHSHDDGVNWTSIVINTQGPFYNLAIGQHNPDKVWIMAEAGSNPDSLWRSDTHGHSFVQEFPISSNSSAVRVFVPYEGNVLDTEVLFGVTSLWGRSTDSGDTWNGSYSAATMEIPAVPGNGFPKFHDQDSNTIWSINNSTTVYLSTNRLISVTTQTSPESIDDAAILRGLWYTISKEKVTPGTQGPSVQTSPTFTTGSFTERSGNIYAAVFGSAAVSLIAGIAPDFNS